MFAVTTALAAAWAPPLFPAQGRLPIKPEDVMANYKKQVREQEAYLCELSEAAGRRVGFTCSQSLHISLFFDGTGNNNEHDTSVDPAHPTNIAKLYHASLRGDDVESKGYFSYYMPGVGTPFPKIGELDYSDDGLKYASGGENRINWALLMLVDALTYTVTSLQTRLSDEVAKSKLSDMRAHWPLTGEVNRRNVINNLLAPLKAKVPLAKPHLLNIKLYIYGFSRGAAEARTFVSWLTELFPARDGKAEMALLGLPVSIEFLGVLDTVPSVGIAHILPFAEGHMGWANGTQQLPDGDKFPNLIKCCRHFVAAHEQRLCFPLDTIRRPEGVYPAQTKEVIYPGMHSDVGGGYPPGEQGKARGGVGEVLSQIVLHDMYAAAFAAGAPLTAPEEAIPDELKQKQPFRAMPSDFLQEFAVFPVLVKRFNLWRTTLLDAETAAQPSETDELYGYHPHDLSMPLEEAIVNQMGWLTAWRIGRYAHGSYQTQPFFTQAKENSADQQAIDEKERKKDQAQIEAGRKAARLNPDSPDAQENLNKQGLPAYEATIDQTQLKEAAQEFRSDYFDWGRDQNSWQQIVLDTIPQNAIYLLNSDEEEPEYRRMKGDGDRIYPKLFKDRLGSITQDPKMAEVCALYDDQVHDSRAWFMYSTLKGRELWGGFFRYRMIYCGTESNKSLSLVSIAGRVVGVATLAGGVIYGVRNKKGINIATGALAGFGVGMAAMTVERKIIDLTTGEAATLLPDALALFQPTDDIGSLTASQTNQAIASQYEQSKKSMLDYLVSVGTELV
ncbi:hypothetical protein ED28_06990 [[Pantoea] beijingensis]|uniref:DUF2235 domain-containing protein n=1 Tax=[Pantoea] beijingensis TaxID=1324864 RepID=A0A443IEV6_9GAMM|nr:DUF2235 domain-containing protein [[Pantoea] beijingensis]RWR02603.1 hypothetical protein ED28_06990 [[Pantoea] beijingensis]